MRLKIHDNVVVWDSSFWHHLCPPYNHSPEKNDYYNTAHDHTILIITTNKIPNTDIQEYPQI